MASPPNVMLRSARESLTSDDAPEPQLVATAIRELVDMSGKRPLRTVVGIDYGVSDLNRAAEPVQRGLLDALGMGGPAQRES